MKGVEGSSKAAENKHRGRSNMHAHGKGISLKGVKETELS